MFNVESKVASDPPLASPERPANRKTWVAAAGVIFLCIFGAISVGLAFRFFNPESALNLSQNAVSGQATRTETAPLTPEATETLTATHAFGKIKSLVMNNRLATAGITLAIVAVLVGIIVTTVLLSQSETNTVVDPTLVDPKPGPENGTANTQPQPVLPEEDEPGLSLGASIGIGVGSVLALVLLAGGAAVLCRKNAGPGAQELIILNQVPEGRTGAAQSGQRQTNSTQIPELPRFNVETPNPPSTLSNLDPPQGVSDNDEDYDALLKPTSLQSSVPESSEKSIVVDSLFGPFKFNFQYVMEKLLYLTVYFTGSPPSLGQRFRFVPEGVNQDLVERFKSYPSRFGLEDFQLVKFEGPFDLSQLTLSLEIETYGMWLKMGDPVKIVLESPPAQKPVDQ